MALELKRVYSDTPHSYATRSGCRCAFIEADLDEAAGLLVRLLDAEDRIGLVFPVMDDARRFLAGRERRRSARASEIDR